MMSPTAPKFILFAHARSGSSNLLKALQLHPWLRIAEEPFHEKYHVWHPDERKYVELITDVPSLKAQLAVLFAKYNGLKVLDYQLPMAPYTHLLLRPEFRVIFLRRRNMLQAVISGCIAKQTGVWKMWDLQGDITTVYAHLQPIPLDEIARTLAYQRELQEYYRQVIAHKPTDMRLLLEYETFYTADLLQNRAAMQRVFGFLGLEMPERKELDYFLNPRTSKINNQRTCMYVPNADEINARFGSNETGWLFEEQPVHNETVEKVQFSAFLEKILVDNQWLMSGDFQVLGFFDNLNKGMQRTRVTAAPLHARRVCQAWHRTHGVEVLVPGDRGAEGEEKGKGVHCEVGSGGSPIHTRGATYRNRI